MTLEELLVRLEARGLIKDMSGDAEIWDRVFGELAAENGGTVLTVDIVPVSRVEIWAP